MNKHLSLFLTLLLVGINAGCKKERNAPETKTPQRLEKPLPKEFPKPIKIEIRPDMSEEKRAMLELFATTHERSLAEWEVEREVRKNLVWPPSSDFTPQATGRKVRLRVAVQKETMRPGEKLWYQLRVQNVGTEDVIWSESFFVNGRLGSGPPRKWKYILTEPDGSEIKLDGFKPYRRHSGGVVQPIPMNFPQEWSEERKMAEFRKFRLRNQAKSASWARLLPGETIETSYWRFIPISGETGPPSPATTSRFREFKTSYRFTKPGAYKLRVIWDDSLESNLHDGAPSDLVEDMKTMSFGFVESNTVKFEVVP